MWLQVIPRTPRGPGTPARCLEGVAPRLVRVAAGGDCESEPSSLVRPFGSWEVPYASALDEIHYRTTAPFRPTEPCVSTPKIIPDLGSAGIVAHSLRHVKEPISRPARGPVGSATMAGRPPPALIVAPRPALCEGWPATGTLVRKTSRVGPCRLRADDPTDGGGRQWGCQISWCSSIFLFPTCSGMEREERHRWQWTPMAIGA